jgi:hypothetical protein
MTGLSAVRCRCSHVRLTKQHELLSPLTDHPGDGPASISDRIAPCYCRRLSRGMAGTPYRICDLQARRDTPCGGNVRGYPALDISYHCEGSPD